MQYQYTSSPPESQAFRGKNKKERPWGAPPGKQAQTKRLRLFPSFLRQLYFAYVGQQYCYCPFVSFSCSHIVNYRNKSVNLLVIIRVVDSFHEDFAIVYIVGQCAFYKLVNRRGIHRAFLHCRKVFSFIDFTPIGAFFKILFQDQIQPDTSTSTVSFHKRMSNVHFNVLFYYVFKRVFGHFFYQP